MEAQNKHKTKIVFVLNESGQSIKNAALVKAEIMFTSVANIRVPYK